MLTEELCTACLCTGRNLHFIGETGFYDLYTEILNEIPVYDTSQVCIRVCWECRALLRRVQQFRSQVKDSYELLLRTQQNSPPSKPSHLSTHVQHSISYPEVLKHELEIKLEDEHCEPDTFVNDYVVDEPVKKISKAKLKSKKVKSKKAKKTQAKKRKKSTTPEGNVSDVSIDCKPLDNIEDTTDNVDTIDYDDAKSDVVDNDCNVKCPDCDLCFNSENELNVHIDLEHKEVVDKPNGAKATRTRLPEPQEVDGKPQCGECGKVFSSRKTYRYHLNVLHKGQNKHQCGRCGKVYQWKSNLGRHVRSHKARDAGELYCEPCDKRFASVATYRQHLRVSRRHVSENEFSFMCTACGKKFVNKTRLQDHVDWEHLKKIKFRCQLCNKPFKCHTSLYLHMQNVHRDKEKKDNLCHVCGKSYQNAAKLKYHIVAMHTSETPYSCGECGAAFGWYSSLYRHLREVHYKMKLQSSKKKSKRKPEVPTASKLTEAPSMLSGPPMLSALLAAPHLPPTQRDA